MASTKKRTALQAVLAGMLAVSGAAGAQDSIEQQVEQFTKSVHEYRLELSDRQLAQKVTELYEARFLPVYGDDPLDGFTAGDLRHLFRAVDTAVFYTDDREQLVRMRQIFAELQQRGLVTAMDAKQMHGALVSARELVAARDIQARYPDAELPPVPVIREAAGMDGSEVTELVVDPAKQELLRRPFVMPAPYHIVVVAHPRCHFTQDAVKAIKADEALAKMFRGSTWLAPADRNLYMDVFQEWNVENPEQPMTLSFHPGDWPMFESWATPTFYFFRNGALVTSVSGWPAEGRRAELVSAFEKITNSP